MGAGGVRRSQLLLHDTRDERDAQSPRRARLSRLLESLESRRVQVHVRVCDFTHKSMCEMCENIEPVRTPVLRLLQRTYSVTYSSLYGDTMFCETRKPEKNNYNK